MSLPPKLHGHYMLFKNNIKLQEFPDFESAVNGLRHTMRCVINANKGRFTIHELKELIISARGTWLLREEFFDVDEMIQSEIGIVNFFLSRVPPITDNPEAATVEYISGVNEDGSYNKR